MLQTRGRLARLGVRQSGSSTRRERLAVLDARQSDGRPRRLGPNPGRLASSARTPNRLAGSAAHMALHVAPHGVHVFSTRPRRPQMPFFIDFVTEQALRTSCLRVLGRFLSICSCSRRPPLVKSLDVAQRRRKKLYRPLECASSYALWPCGDGTNRLRTALM